MHLGKLCPHIVVYDPNVGCARSALGESKPVPPFDFIDLGG
jgi:hypothetical protein